jgi:hypothetical protein
MLFAVVTRHDGSRDIEGIDLDWLCRSQIKVWTQAEFYDELADIYIRR